MSSLRPVTFSIRRKTPGRAGQQPRQVPGPVADDRHGLLGERGEDQLALLAVRQHLAGERVDDLRIEVVLPDVQPVLGLHALLRDPGPITSDSPYMSTASIANRSSISRRISSVHGSAPKMPTRREVAARIDALALELVEEGQHVRGRHHDDLGPEVLDQLHLACRHPAGRGDDRTAEPLGPVVRAEPAGEQPVAVGHMDLVPGPAARRADRAGHHVGPHVEVAARCSRRPWAVRWCRWRRGCGGPRSWSTANIPNG